MSETPPTRIVEGPDPDEPAASGESRAAEVATRCGYVALVGAPNVGKSTLMNALVGEPLSIVTPKAQTTWTRITGIRSSDRHQSIFLDTPGLLVPKGLLHRAFLAGAEEAVCEADVVVVMADPTRSLDAAGRARVEETLRPSGAPRLGVVNKVDAAGPEAVESERRWLESLEPVSIHLVSAREAEGLAALLEEIEALLPPGPFLYPEDEIASAPVREFVAEMVREAIFDQFHQEIPYASICRVEEFREAQDPTYIQVTIYVERESQKGILVGQGGRAIRALGAAARHRIEHFLQTPVYLDLWVKVLPNWRRRPDQLRRLGFPIPAEDRAP